MKLVEKLMVYKGQYGYQTLLKNGEDKLYVQVGFKKGCEPTQEKVMIDIHNGFLSCYGTRDGGSKPKIVVLEYVELETLQDNHGEAWEDPNTTVNDDELPF